MRGLLTILAGVIALGGYVPYAFDILKGKAKPARSARIMFVLLLTLTMLQQTSLHSGTLIVFTLGELIGTLAILVLAIKHGIGGWTKLDKICYLLLFVDIGLWLITGNTLLALHFSVLADIIAFTPTVVKTWINPKSETALFFLSGVASPIVNILATNRYSYAVLLFPIYISLANLTEALIIIFKGHQSPWKINKLSEPVI